MKPLTRVEAHDARLIGHSPGIIGLVSGSYPIAVQSPLAYHGTNRVRASGNRGGASLPSQLARDVTIPLIDADPARMAKRYDIGDALHPNDAGFAAMAAAVDLRLLR